MDLNINNIEVCTDIPECITAKEIKHTIQNDDSLKEQMTYLIHEWPLARGEVKDELQSYLPFRDNIIVNDSITMMRRRRRIPFSLNKRELQQLHVIHMEIEKTRLLAHDSIYWFNINFDIENAVCLTFR